MLKISLVHCLFLVFTGITLRSVASPEQEKSMNNISIDFDQLFLKSANSKEYYVIHEMDVEKLSNYFRHLKDSTTSLITTLHENNESITQSYLSTVHTVDSLEQIVKNSIKEKENYSAGIEFFKKWFIPVLLSILSVFLGFNYLKMKIKYREDLESLEEIENQFHTYKKNAVERERKLVREIIDLKREE
ncbi:hypothetical protein [Cecembia lonarensis]|uniref:Uncharacterized protein n=1 Tax=Cecembia lonarensis (strain CCUG 58316 / KCTC 22772 / LW9) TaxID=1225176 RepID=K1L9L2_CECL9|nr:hypothetical protein [Cecembia lonarensis]EKB48897.1 hypothetical protein B879_02465 [Cecembia lonarensis LW9]